MDEPAEDLSKIRWEKPISTYFYMLPKFAQNTWTNSRPVLDDASGETGETSPVISGPSMPTFTKIYPEVDTTYASMIQVSFGWWYTYPSEKYESQLGWWHSQYMEK